MTSPPARVTRVSSSTGPFTGTVLSDATRRPESVPGETKILWRADNSTVQYSTDNSSEGGQADHLGHPQLQVTCIIFSSIRF